MDPVTPEQVPQLLPGAPQPEQQHLTLATLWARGELAARRVDLGALTGDAEVAARTAIAAKSLALKAGIGGVIGLSGKAGASKIKVGPIEVTLAARDAHGQAQVAQTEWEVLAGQLLALAVPARPLRGAFSGVAR